MTSQIELIHFELQAMHMSTILTLFHVYDSAPDKEKASILISVRGKPKPQHPFTRKVSES